MAAVLSMTGLASGKRGSACRKWDWQPKHVQALASGVNSALQTLCHHSFCLLFLTHTSTRISFGQGNSADVSHGLWVVCIAVTTACQYLWWHTRRVCQQGLQWRCQQSMQGRAVDTTLLLHGPCISSHLPGFTNTVRHSQTKLPQSASRAAPTLPSCKPLYTNSTIW